MRQRDGIPAAVVLLLAVLGVLVLGACSGDANAGGSAEGPDELRVDGSTEGEPASNQVTTVPPTTLPNKDVPPDALPGADGNFNDADVPADQFTNQPASTQGARELPVRMAGYNYLDRDGGEQFTQQSQELEGIEVTIRSLDPVVRTGSGFRPQVLVMKSPTVADVFAKGAWQATQKTLEGQPIWLLGGTDASTQVAWVKKSDTVIILSGAPYSVLEPIMVDIITNSPG